MATEVLNKKDQSHCLTLPSPNTGIFSLQEKLESKEHADLGSRNLGEIKLLKRNNLIFLNFYKARTKETLTPDLTVTTYQHPIGLRELKGLPSLKRAVVGETLIFALGFGFSI